MTHILLPVICTIIVVSLIIYLLLRKPSSEESQPPIDMSTIVGLQGVVYQPIPSANKDYGMVEIEVDGIKQKVYAFADVDETTCQIKVGEPIEVVDYISDFVIVKPTK